MNEKWTTKDLRFAENIEKFSFGIKTKILIFEHQAVKLFQHLWKLKIFGVKYLSIYISESSDKEFNDNLDWSCFKNWELIELNITSKILKGEDFKWLEENIYIKKLSIIPCAYYFYKEIEWNKKYFIENLSLNYISIGNYYELSHLIKANIKLSYKMLKHHPKTFRVGVFEKTYYEKNICYISDGEKEINSDYMLQRLPKHPINDYFYLYWILKQIFPLDIAKIILDERFWVLTTDFKKDYYFSFNFFKFNLIVK
jgi:hypothetical protein